MSTETYLTDQQLCISFVDSAYLGFCHCRSQLSPSTSIMVDPPPVPVRSTGTKRPGRPKGGATR
jgi:hypothetical protein